MLDWDRCLRKPSAKFPSPLSLTPGMQKRAAHYLESLIWKKINGINEGYILRPVVFSNHNGLAKRAA